MGCCFSFFHLAPVVDSCTFSQCVYSMMCGSTVLCTTQSYVDNNTFQSSPIGPLPPFCAVAANLSPFPSRSFGLRSRLYHLCSIVTLKAQFICLEAGLFSYSRTVDEKEETRRKVMPLNLIYTVDFFSMNEYE